MIRRLLSFLCGLYLLLSVGGAAAQTDAASGELLMKKSGLWQQLAEVPAHMRAGLAAAAARSRPPPEAGELDRLERATAAAYGVDRLRTVALQTIANGLDARHVPTLRAWFDSPGGAAITALEEADSADRSDPQAKLLQGMAILEESPSARRALLNEISEVTHAAEMITQSTINTMLAAHRGIASVQPGRPGPSEAEMRALLEAQKPQMLQAFAAVSLTSLATVYRTLPTAELSRYAAFLKSDAGRHFTELAARAVEAALVDASAEFGRRLPAVMS